MAADGGCSWRRNIKALVIAYNVCFWLSGPAILGLGIWLKVSLQEAEPLVEYAQYALPVWLLICAGTAVTIFGVIGCIAAFNEHRSLLGCYFLCMLAVFAAEFGSSLQYFLKYDQIESQAEYNLNSTMQYKYMFDVDARRSIDTIQQKFSCCGIYNWTDWQSARYTRPDGTPPGQAWALLVPSSCCIHGDLCGGTDIGNIQKAVLFKRGCVRPVVDHIRYIVRVVGWSSFATSVMQWVGGILVYCMRSAID